jgi:hypothetical protein
LCITRNRVDHANLVEDRVFASCDEDIERSLHAELEAERAHGEWFRDSDRLRAVVLERMTPASLSVIETLTNNNGHRKQHRCKACGDLGHHAKTCGRLFRPPSI